jgi:hypothetical protein
LTARQKPGILKKSSTKATINMKINYFNLLFVMTISGLSGFYLGPVGVILFAIPFGIIGGLLWPILEIDN